jgi:hypothetical protein
MVTMVTESHLWQDLRLREQAGVDAMMASDLSNKSVIAIPSIAVGLLVCHILYVCRVFISTSVSHTKMVTMRSETTTFMGVFAQGSGNAQSSLFQHQPV